MIDIIIPTYKNKEGLIKTLKSIPYSFVIHITVIDDCSGIDYSDIQPQFPYVQWFILDKNCGPGVARQYGLDHTEARYIMFIDTGDWILDPCVFSMIQAEIEKNRDAAGWKWQYITSDKKIIDNSAVACHGYVYRRDLINQWHITFSTEGSYANEDVGFTRSYRLLSRDKGLILETYNVPILCYELDPNSITRADNHNYAYTKHLKGVYLNSKHTIDCLRANNGSEQILLDEITRMFWYMWGIFIIRVTNKPEYAAEYWDYIQDYYFTYFKPCMNYADFEDTNLTSCSRAIKYIHENVNDYRFNPTRIIREIETNKQVPQHYKEGDIHNPLHVVLL